MNLMALTTHFEGRRATVYDDKTGRSITKGSVVEGHPTIAIGLALDVNPLDDEAIDWLYHHQMAKVYKAAKLNIPGFDALTMTRQWVIILMVYQMGIQGVLEFKDMLRALAREDYTAAAEEMLDSDWHKETEYRCEALAEAMRSDSLDHIKP